MVRFMPSVEVQTFDATAERVDIRLEVGAPLRFVATAEAGFDLTGYTGKILIYTPENTLLLQRPATIVGQDVTWLIAADLLAPLPAHCVYITSWTPPAGDVEALFKGSLIFEGPSV